jgi:RNA polymerase sigma factor (sigma-70 family)
LNKIGTYDQSKCLFRSWLFKVTQRTLIDFFRRKASRDRVIQEVAARMQQMTPFDSARLEQEWRKIHREKIMRHALKIVRAQVKPDIWACFEQRLLKDRPAAEIARELGVDPNVVFVRASRVLKQVREVCDEFDEDMSYAFESDVS